MLRLAQIAALRITLVVAVSLAPLSARAQQPGGSPTTVEQPAEPPIAPLPAGTAAPFDGLLVPPLTFSGYLRLQAEVGQLRVNFKDRDDRLRVCVPEAAGCSVALKQCQDKIGPKAILDRFWVGATVATVVIGGIAWGICKAAGSC